MPMRKACVAANRSSRWNAATGEADRVVSILDSEGVLDLDERQAAWRSEGWQGHDVSVAGSSGGLGGGGLGYDQRQDEDGRHLRAR